MVVEDRFECVSTSQVNYTYRDEYCLPLSVPLEECVNKEDIENYFMRRYYYGAQMLVLQYENENKTKQHIGFMFYTLPCLYYLIFFFNVTAPFIDF